MMRSLFSGVSGLKAHQTKMDVIGNNIANVNTIGFKSSSVNFSDVYYQTLQNASGANEATGSAGTNAMQIGLGADTASITCNVTGTGGTQRTDRSLDLMINGNAFLVVGVGNETFFTKAGALNIDERGTLYSTSNGGTVMGWQADAQGNILKDTVSALNVLSPENVYSPPTETTDITLSGNIDQNDKNVAYDEDGAGYIINASFYDKIGNSYIAKLKVMLKEGSTNEYTVNVTDVLDKDSKSIFYTSTEDENGNKTYTPTTQTISFGGKELAVTLDPITGELALGTEADTSGLVFNGSSGAFTSVGDPVGNTLNLTLNDGGLPNNPFPTAGFEVDFSALTMYSTGGISDIEPTRGDVDGNGAGNIAGSLSGITISDDGKIYGVYDNGDNKCFGQIALATFANPSGLESIGGSLFKATLNSGEFDGIGVDPSTVGKITIGALEMSNVDLSTEFTSMITTQRGFQANSRIITTSDSLLEELINLKR